jgi:hypothetical protein
MDIKITHHSIEIPEKGIIKYVPKELAYCNPQQFKDVAQLLYNWQAGKIDYHDFRVQAVYKLLNLIPGKRKLNRIEEETMYANIASISYIMDSFFDVTDRSDKRIKLNVVENPVPYVKPVFLRIYGPKPRLTNTNFGQYEDASNLYHMYYRSHDDKYLYQLFATYYQEPRRYAKDKTESKAAYFKKTIDFAQVYSFFLFFEAFQNYVTSSKVLWEGKVIDLSILFSGVEDSEKSSLPGLGTKSLAFQIAESGVFGSLKELRSENLWEILLRLYDLRKRDMDAEAQRKKETKNA